MIHVTKCCHNVRAVTSSHRGIKDNIGTGILFPTYRNLQNNVIMQLDTYKLNRTRVMLLDIWRFAGGIAPNKIPLTTIVTYLQKRYRSRISNHWATILACSVVPPVYKQSKKTYCHVSF